MLVDKGRSRTLSSCLHAKSSSWPTGRRSMTGREIVFMEDSIISAPYCIHMISTAYRILKQHTRTFTTLELALLCS